jgi:hypothetical protein
MAGEWISTLIASAATLLGVGLGAWLTSLRESWTSQRKRSWDIFDQQRLERRDIYIRFLVASDNTTQQAWETGRKRTSVQSIKQRQQHYQDWIAVRNNLQLHLTEMRLSASPEISGVAAVVALIAMEFGKKALLAGMDEGKDFNPSGRQRKYNEQIDHLIGLMKLDLGISDETPWSVPIPATTTVGDGSAFDSARTGQSAHSEP